MPGLRVTARTPRAYNRPASSAICALRGSRCWPCQCSPVTPTFHSTVPSAARAGSASPICRSASITAEWAVDSCGIRCHCLALDPLSLVFEPEYPRGETCGLDRVVRADRHPVAVAAGVGSATGPTRVLSEHLLSPLDPETELVRSQVHPPARRGGTGITAVSRDHDDAAAVQPLAVRRENRDPHRQNMA